jgi:hypothetical protein
LSVVASSAFPLSYQWRLNGFDLIGETNSTLTITNVQIANGGDYTVVISDMYGSIISQTARLVPLIRPVFVNPPINQSVASNAVLSVSGEWVAWPPPFTTEWRRGSIKLMTNILNETYDFFTIPDKSLRYF